MWPIKLPFIISSQVNVALTMLCANFKDVNVTDFSAKSMRYITMVSKI